MGQYWSLYFLSDRFISLHNSARRAASIRGLGTNTFSARRPERADDTPREKYMQARIGGLISSRAGFQRCFGISASFFLGIGRHQGDEVDVLYTR